MANAKQTKVTLFGGEAGTREFEISHAERLLSWKGSGWTLADDAYEWNGSALVRKPAKTDKETKKK